MDSVKDYFKLGIILLFQLFKLLREFFARRYHLPKPYECPHNLYVDCDALSLLSTLESIAMPCSVNA